VLGCFSGHAALLTFDQSGPFYSNFATYGLDVNYVYSGTTSSGTGVYTVSSPYSSSSLVANNTDTYVAGSSAPGTHGASNGSFSGIYSLTANISYNNGVASLTGGTFDIYQGSTSTILLSGNLVLGAGSSAFGFVDHTATMSTGEYNEFDFLIDLNSLAGNQQMVEDFLKGFGGTEGGIQINAGFDYGHVSGGKTVYNYNNGSKTTTANVIPPASSYEGFDGIWNHSFANPLAAGTADTFVPEPVVYPVAASAVALAGVVLVRRKNGRVGGAVLCN
jgi:hypothetical protein